MRSRTLQTQTRELESDFKESGDTISVGARSPLSGSRKADRKTLILFAVFFSAACLLYFVKLGSHPLFNPDEALYAEPAREMLETGEYVTTYLNYQVRYTKPPLCIWAMAMAFKTFGVTEFAARFFSAACGAILLGATYLFTEKYASRRAAVLASLALLLAPLYLASSRLAITDIPLSLFVAGSLMSLYHGFQSGEGRWKWLGYLLIGLGVMTKGPVALLIPGAIMVAYHALAGEIKKAWRYYNPIGALAFIALIAVPWFALEIYVTRGEYYEAFILRENFQRFTAVVDHKYPWWYHIAAMFGGFFPWSLCLPFAWFASLKGFWKDRAGTSSKFGLFLSVWSLFILGFFSASVSKLIPYTLPAFPAVAALSGVFLAGLIERRARLPIASGMALVAALACGNLFTLHIVEAKVRDCPPDLIAALPAAITAIALCAFSGLVLALSRRLYASLVVFGCSMLLAFGWFGPVLLDVFASEWEEPVVAYSRYAALSDRPILVHSIRKPSVTFYAGRRVEVCPTADLLGAHMHNHEKAYIIARSKDADFFESITGCKILDKCGRFMLVSWNQPEMGGGQ
ncbi:MAG: glycosyltransferase family 39 protein [Candidatus Melainabacteria bacterium]|nr:glycosyltransferase family 39 protein [Candidatus Melainabacteria bacterium]